MSIRTTLGLYRPTPPVFPATYGNREFSHLLIVSAIRRAIADSPHRLRR
jgi:hypothetical protein